MNRIYKIDKIYDYYIIGSGFSGSILANHFAKKNKKVLIIEKRNHIAGNMYDYKIDNILTHKYGPHILYFNSEKVYEFLTRYTELVQYRHAVYASVDNNLLPLPINLNSLKTLFPDNYESIIKNILIEFKNRETITIHDLMNSKLNKNAANIIYEKIFFHYSKKMWGIDPKNLDPFVMARIPIKMNYDNNHFNQKYQFMPKFGYTKLFNNLLDSHNIDIIFNTDARDVIKIASKKTHICGLESEKIIIYTGPIDHFLNYKFGVLNYRSLNIIIERKETQFFQKYPVINYPDDREYTRITDMKLLNCQNEISNHTITIKEVPSAFDEKSKIFNERYYPMPTNEDQNKYDLYAEILSKCNNFYLLGRLAKYKYINMESTILEAFDLINKFDK